MKNLNVVTRGEPGLPPVLLLHGLLGSARNLIRVMDAIAADGYHVTAYDQRGHGHSPHGSTNDDYQIECMASDVWDMLDHLGIESAHLVGHSMGARVCLSATNLNPKRVKSLTMLDAGILMSESAYQDLRSIIEPLPDSFGSREEAETALNMHPPGIRQFLVSNLRPSGTGRYRWMFDLRHIRDALLENLRADQTESWRKLSRPALVARGELSKSFPEQEQRYMLTINPRARGTVIANAGHWVPVDNFNGTVEAVCGFLGTVES